MTSMYANYDELITAIALEANESDDDYDAIILEFLKDCVGFLNTIKAPFREKTSDPITLAANDWDYDLSSLVTDFGQLIDKHRSVYYLDDNSNPVMVRWQARQQFMESWSRNSSGDPCYYNIFAETLRLKPTPAKARSLYLDYYFKLTTPATDGTVQIPDEFIQWIKGKVGTRLANHKGDENSTIQIFAAIYAEARQEWRKLSDQETMPDEVVSSWEESD